MSPGAATVRDWFVLGVCCSTGASVRCLPLSPPPVLFFADIGNRDMPLHFRNVFSNNAREIFARIIPRYRKKLRPCPMTFYKNIALTDEYFVFNWTRYISCPRWVNKTKSCYPYPNIYRVSIREFIRNDILTLYFLIVNKIEIIKNLRIKFEKCKTTNSSLENSSLININYLILYNFILLEIWLL